MYRIHNAAWHSYRGSPHCKPLDDLAKFVHDCSDDNLTRSMAATAMVLAFAQVSGPSMIAHPPGYLLIDMGGAASDPIDSVVGKLTGMSEPKPAGDPESFERNRKWMIQQVNEVSRAKAAGQLTDELIYARRQAYQQSSVRAFGGARVGAYARRHDKELGWIAELLRKQQWLRADQRDAVLERLAHEGLVTLSDRHVSAVTAADYLRSIPARSGMAAPLMHPAHATTN